jgi:predicted secreted hydrolase
VSRSRAFVAARRAWLRAAGAAAAAGAGGAHALRVEAAPVAYPPVERSYRLAFPRDFGAHPAYRIEWWYLTGWLRRPNAAPCGFQVTFFRSRTEHDDANPSRLAPKQLLFAHAALALPERRALLHDERAARQGLGLAQAKLGDCEVSIGDWRLARADRPDGGSRWSARLAGASLSMALDFDTPRPPLLQGEAGFSRKGPDPAQASHYYSQPHLAVSGEVAVVDAGRASATAVRGEAWLDHEWSSTLLDPRAAGWDWIGINLADGASLVAFRVRDKAGGTLWSHASWAAPDGSAVARGQARWRPLRTWTSHRTGAAYPVAAEVEVGGATIELVPMMDDQEVDARGSTGTVYWEGAVVARHRGREIGRGYLELTGYAGAVRI